MSSLDEYANKFQSIKLERRNGILQMSLHTNGGPLQWGPIAQSELVEAFTAIGADRDNRIIIMTGTGRDFSGPKAEPGKSFYREVSEHITAALLDRVHWNAKRLMTRMLDIEVPMIAVVNGPAMRHSELPLMCDIVLASDDAYFQDMAHFPRNLSPGDGIQNIWPLVIGRNRFRYAQLMGQKITAQMAQEWGD